MQADGREDLRPPLFSIAYRMLGTVGDPEDVVQEAYLRLHQSEVEGANPDIRRQLRQRIPFSRVLARAVVACGPHWVGGAAELAR